MLKENNEQREGIWKRKIYDILSSVCRCGMSMRLWVQILLEALVSTKKNPQLFEPVLLHSCGKAAEVIIL